MFLKLQSREHPDFGTESSLPGSLHKTVQGLVKGYVSEKTGIPISALLCNNQLGESDNCGKPDCNPCLSGTTKKLSCRKVSRGGMVYTCNCISCKQAVLVKESWYHGRSARTLYTRQGEHITGWEAGKEENALHKHAQLFHQGEDDLFGARGAQGNNTLYS